MIAQIKHPRKACCREALPHPTSLCSVCVAILGTSTPPRDPPDALPPPQPSTPSKAHAVCEAVAGEHPRSPYSRVDNS